MHTVIAETDEAARSAMRNAREYFNVVLQEGIRTAQRTVMEKSRFHQEQANRERWLKRADTRRGATMEEAIERGTILCGSPETVVQQIRRAHGELGHGVFNFTAKVGNLPDDIVRRGMELFRDRVHPHVKDL